MNRMIAALLTALMCLSLAACGKASPQTPGAGTSNPGGSEPQSSSSALNEEQEEHPEPPAQQRVDVTGLWHLDSDKNDLAAFADSLDLFPGYGEWGAGMEIQSDGQLSWYIGAEGWHGTYTLEDGVIHAQLTSDLEQAQQRWDLRIHTEQDMTELEMDYGDMTIYWAYGPQEDPPMGADNA